MLGPLGALLDALGALLGLSWSLLGSLGALLRFSWGFLSFSGTTLGVFLDFLGPTASSCQAFFGIDFAYEKPVFCKTTCVLPMKNQYF